VNHSDTYLKLAPKEKRPISLSELIDQMTLKVSELGSVNINYLMPLADKINDALGGIPVDLGVDLFGPDLKVLHDFSEVLRERFRKVPGVSSLRAPTDMPVPSLEIQVDKVEAGRLGISESTIHDALQAYSVGVTATSVRQLQKQVPVIVHLNIPSQDLQLDSLRALPLRTSSGNTVPLNNLVQLSYGDIPNEIYHEQLTRKLTIGANVKGRNSSEIAQDFEGIINRSNLPAGYTWAFSGKYRTEQKALSNMMMVLSLAISVVAFILWISFRSLIQTGLILLTLPLAAVGAILSLWLFKETINVSSMMGAVMLVGIVVRNGIMLLDCSNTLLREGYGFHDALYHAAMKRVRPILMTATVTILGLLPLAIGWGAGAELQKPLAIAVIGGILTSTMMTLVVLPAAARLLEGRNTSS
jgi:cobalt-zinc-cadmium resistance protein CzcA